MKKNFGHISKDVINEVVAQSDLVGLIGGYVQLKPAGKNFLGLCPFHNEKTPSFNVSPSRQSYHCFGCGAHGDAIKFMMEIESFQFPEAVKYLADRFGVAVTFSDTSSTRDSQKSEFTRCLEKGLGYYQSRLLKTASDSIVSHYLTERQISKTSIEKFQLGYTGTGWSNLHEYLNRNQVSKAVQEGAGLIKEGKNNSYYDRLRERLIFPIRDIQGRVLGFAGRIIGEGGPKYLNPPETELYKKSSVFYGIYEARDAVRRSNRAIIVEGYLDVIRLHENSWNEAIATCGTALNETHIKTLKRYGIKEVCLLFDGDKAGISAAEKSARLFFENDIDSRVVVLPDGMDPDDYFKAYSSEDFKSLIDTADFDYEFIIKQVKEETKGKGIETQKQMIDEVAKLSSGLKNQLKKDLFLSKVSSEFKINKSVITQEQMAAPLRYSYTETANVQGPGFPIQFPEEEKFDVALLQYIIKQPMGIGKVRKYVVPEDFSGKKNAELFARLLQLSDEEFKMLQPIDFQDIFIEYNQRIVAILESIRDPRTDSFSETVLDEIIFKLKNRKLSKIISQLQNTEKDRDMLIQIRKLRSQISHLRHRNTNCNPKQN